MTKSQYIYYRVCTKCGTEKELTGTNFRRNVSHGKGRYRSQCKDCDFKLKVQEHWKDGKLKCFICKEYKDEESFSKAKANKHRNGRDRRCGDCKSTEAKIRRESLSGQMQIDRLIKERWLGARDRAKCRKIEFTITEDHINALLVNQQYRCILSGVLMTFELGNGRTPTNMSIDRIDSNNGYVVGNVQLVCAAVNQFKNDLSQEYFIEMCKKIVSYHENKNNKDSYERIQVEKRVWW